MMETPIFNFVQQYAQSGQTRLHMPGHKGEMLLGCEKYDITEIDGADDVYHAQGIIAQSEQNATNLFATRQTFYGTGGSSQSVKAMLYLAMLHKHTKSNVIFAARNAHKSFLHGCALLGIEPKWLYPEESDSLCSCMITKSQLENELSKSTEKPMAVYITSPDYLGKIADVKALSEICHAHQVPLLVDNAHGAYLRFLRPSQHPMDLGADLCCDSAHKTLPVLTGGAYLHVAHDARAPYEKDARQALAAFGSSSPSYLILQSLDLCNAFLNDQYQEKLDVCIVYIQHMCEQLKEKGLVICESDALRVVLDANAVGYTGDTLAEILREQGIEIEYSDMQFAVMMFTPCTKKKDYSRVVDAFSRFVVKEGKAGLQYKPLIGERVLSPRDAFLSKHVRMPVHSAENRICANPSVACPPAIPIVVSGERITKEAITLFKAYGITHIEVLCEI